MRRLRHRLAAADETDIGMPQQNLLGAADDGLKSRSAQSIEGERRSLDRGAALERDMPREVRAVGGRRDDVAKDRLRNISRRYALPLYCGFGRDDGEIDCCRILEGAAECPEGRTRPREKDYFHNREN
jgi:hypothetical protein